ncbi:MAG: hypothetical protein ACRD12_06985 [Acidimicrobiales bacterium]
MLFLDGDAAVERLMAEDANHRHRLELGHQALWERLESLREGGIDLRGMTPVPSGPWRVPEIRDLAREVRRLREERRIGGGLAEVTYEMQYRHESIHDVHVGFDLLTRY